MFVAFLYFKGKEVIILINYLTSQCVRIRSEICKKGKIKFCFYLSVSLSIEILAEIDCGLNSLPYLFYDDGYVGPYFGYKPTLKTH